MTLSQGANDSKPKRAFGSHTPKWQRFQTNFSLPSNKTSDSTSESHIYQRQYSHVYAQRLAMLKPRCWEAVPADLASTRVLRVLDLREHVPSIVVGTLVKEQGDSIHKDDHLPLHPNTRCRESDTLILEDESGRVTLETDQVHQWCTGVVVAVQGTVQEGGILQVETFCPPSPGPSLSPVSGQLLVHSTHNNLAPHVMLLSGLQCGNPSVNSLKRDMLLAYLEGHLTLSAAKICRVIVAGGSTGQGDPSAASPSSFGVKELDGWLSQICAAGLPVDLLPGQDDPTTANWPQRPLHSSLLKYSGTYLEKLLSRTPNPYAASIGDKYVVGSDGRNIQDLTMSLVHKDKMEPFAELEALKATLQWGHICPTGPDSVPTVPHAETDPMVLTETPHVYFAGNCSRFATDLITQTNGMQTRLVCVPKFADTGEVVLVNLETLTCELLQFDDRSTA